jgi:hypothetical protein
VKKAITRFPDGQVFDVLEILEVTKEWVQVVGDDPSAAQGVSLHQSQGTGASCGAGITDWQNILQTVVGEDNHNSGIDAFDYERLNPSL